jgi:glycine/D-amino acid oxidase-like deaminating enzyme/nitrite reductase/ring-hydroxylating ferredoxin subunit
MAISGTTKSVWMRTDRVPACDKGLSQNVTADVCVVGAGIAGLSVAYELATVGKKVIVIDDGPIGGGETFRTTAHLVNALDDRYFELESLHGADGARLAAQSHTKAVDRIEDIVRGESIDCDFTRLDGFLFAPPDESSEELQRELEAAHRAGLTQVEMVPSAPISGFNTGKALRFPNQAQFHIQKYLTGLAQAITARGGKIFCGVHAEFVTGGDAPKVVTSSGVVISAAAIAVCTNTPVNDRFAIHTKQMPYRTYVIAIRVPNGSVTRALYWDTPDPYHYVRLMHGSDPDSGSDLLIVGGEDHKTGQEDDADARFANLEKWARERWPQAGAVEYRWSGQVMEPDDGMAFIGKNPLDEKNIYIATGDSGNGMTHGTIAGILLSDLILGQPNPWQKLYDPRRIRLKATGEWLKENVNTFAQYSDYATAGDVSSADQIEPGQGAIIRDGLTKVACYREPSGELRKFSAVCPHLGAILRWNSKEKTWDCPAHGSRFDCNGCVINGPANSNLVEQGEAEKAA